MGPLSTYRPTGVIWRRACVLVHRLILAVSHRYRPERHYMRGPGPKFRARNARED